MSHMVQASITGLNSGDLTSFKYNGVEFAAPYASPGPQRYSHVESGMSNTAVISATVDPNGNWIKITCDDSTATVGTGDTGETRMLAADPGDLVLLCLPNEVELLNQFFGVLMAGGVPALLAELRHEHRMAWVPADLADPGAPARQPCGDVR